MGIMAAGDLVARGREAFNSGHYQEAVKALRDALRLSPGDPALWDAYGQALVAQRADDFLSGLPQDRYKMMPWVYEKLEGSGRPLLILDVREPKEFDQGHLKGAINIPLRRFMKRLDLVPRDRTTTVLLVCRTQHRSNYVMEALRELGYQNVYNLAGGYRAYLLWKKKGSKAAPVTSRPREGPRVPPSGDNQTQSDDEDEVDFGC